LYCQAEEQQGSLPDDIVSVLSQNADDLNQISITWKRKRSSEMDFELLTKTIKCLYDYGFLEDRNSVFMWQNPKSYLYYVEKDTIEGDHTTLPYAYEIHKSNTKLIESVLERSFDGTNIYNGNGSTATEFSTSGLGIYTKENALKAFARVPVCFPDYFLYAGYKFPLAAEELGTSQQSYILFLINQGRLIDFQKHDNHVDSPFVVITIESEETQSKRKRIFEFLLLSKFNFAIKKWTMKTLDNKLLYEVENKEFVELSGKKIFLPKSIEVKHYSYVTVSDFVSPTPLFSERYLLAEISVKKIAAKQFDLRTKYSQPGTHIGDRTLTDTNKGVQYVVPANPADLDRVIEAALNGTDFIPTPLPSTAAIIVKWLLCLAGIAMIFYAGYKKFVKK
jgi:hypothetical protein